MSSLALVTGATAGIGAAFARQLASEGSSLILVATNLERLEATAEEIRRRYGVQVDVMAADLAEPESLASVEDRLRAGDRPVDLLINNAGFGMKGSFTDISADDHERMLRVNALAVLRLAHSGLGAMQQRGTGGVINVASVAAFVTALRSSSTYAATKAFVVALTEGLAPTLEGTGVHMSAVCPGYVRSEFHQRAGIDMSKLPEFLWLSADEVVAAALADHRSGKILSIPGGQYKVISTLARMAPKGAVRKVSRIYTRRAH